MFVAFGLATQGNSSVCTVDLFRVRRKTLGLQWFCLGSNAKALVLHRFCLVSTKKLWFCNGFVLGPTKKLWFNNGFVWGPKKTMVLQWFCLMSYETNIGFTIVLLRVK